MKSYGRRIFLSMLVGAFSLMSSISYAGSTGRPFRSVMVTLAEDGGAYYEQVVRGAEKGARTVDPHIKFTAMSCKDNAVLQMQQIDEAVSEGIDLIIIQRSYSGDSSAAVQRARRAGVTVVAIDSDVPGGTDGLVKPDELQGGVLAGRFVAEKLGGHGKVAIADGPATSGPLQLRVKGFTSELKKYSGIEIVEDRDTGMSRASTREMMGQFLARHPDLAAVYGVNDPVAFYCELEALAQKRTEVFIVGMEGSPTSVKAMKDSQRLIVASPGEEPFTIAEAAVKLGAEIRTGARESGETVLVPFVELTRANVQNYQGWTH